MILRNLAESVNDACLKIKTIDTERNLGVFNLKGAGQIVDWASERAWSEHLTNGLVPITLNPGLPDRVQHTTLKLLISEIKF